MEGEESGSLSCPMNTMVSRLSSKLSKKLSESRGKGFYRFQNGMGDF